MTFRLLRLRYTYILTPLIGGGWITPDPMDIQLVFEDYSYIAKVSKIKLEKSYRFSLICFMYLYAERLFNYLIEYGSRIIQLQSFKGYVFRGLIGICFVWILYSILVTFGNL